MEQTSFQTTVNPILDVQLQSEAQTRGPKLSEARCDVRPHSSTLGSGTLT